MRIISGNARGRRLRAGKGQAIRPTASKVKGAVFNILASRFFLEDAEILDLFAGAGTLGIEALSRGAARVTFVESSAAAARILRDNIERCAVSDRVRVIQATAAAALRRLRGEAARFDGVFMDPPYDAGWIERTLRDLAGAGVVRAGGWIVAEHSITEPVPDRCGDLQLTQERRYGKTALAILTADGDTDQEATEP